MSRIFIDPNIFKPESEIKQVVKALHFLSDLGIEISTEKSVSDNKFISALLKNEEINFDFSPMNQCDYVVSYQSDVRESILICSGENLFQKVYALFKPERKAFLERKTKETDIKCNVNLDGSGKTEIKTGIGFFDHMLSQISRHGNIDLSLVVNGDLDVDEHHTVEDTGLVLGEAITNALGEKRGIKRYAFFLPMDDCAAKVAIDLGGRPYINYKVKFTREKVGEFPTELVEEFFRALSVGMKANIFVRAKGKNEHHKIESIFKAFAKALNEALRIDERSGNALPSTKGVL